VSLSDYTHETSFFEVPFAALTQRNRKRLREALLELAQLTKIGSEHSDVSSGVGPLLNKVIDQPVHHVYLKLIPMRSRHVLRRRLPSGMQ
jgi:hypothetical protein